jgi:hypothetical protein
MSRRLVPVAHWEHAGAKCSTFSPVVNLRTVQGLGLTIPQRAPLQTTANMQ